MPSLRHDSIKIPRCNKVNPPIARLRQKRLRRLKPPTEVEDPYIVAILIALAQEQRQVNRRQGTEVVTAEKATATGKSGVNAASSQFRASTMTSLPSPPEATEKRPQETASSFKVCPQCPRSAISLSTPLFPTAKLSDWPAGSPSSYPCRRRAKPLLLQSPRFHRVPRQI